MSFLSLLVPFSRTFLPEIQEEFIDQLGSDGQIPALRQCALTCRAWHLRSRLHLFRAIRAQTVQQLDDIYTVLRADPVLQSVVYSITIDSPPATQASKRVPPVSDIIPVLLFNLQLPTLRRWTLSQHDAEEAPVPMTVLHPVVLTCLRFHTAARIETICLWHVHFSGPAEFARLLAALPMLEEVECIAVKFHSWENRDRMPKPAVRLRTLTIREPYDTWSSLQWLLNVTRGRVEHLVLQVYASRHDEMKTSILPWSEEYTQATSPTATGTLNVWGINFSQDTDFFRRCGELFCKLSPPAVSKYIQISLDGSNSILSSGMQRPNDLLQQTLLNLSPRTVEFVSTHHKRNRQLRLDKVFRRTFPTLYECNIAKTIFHAGSQGHNYELSAISVSPDGLWVASAASDKSVILWRTEDGSAVHDWYNPSPYPSPSYVNSPVSFSPDSQYLATLHQPSYSPDPSVKHPLEDPPEDPPNKIILRDAQNAFRIVASYEVGPLQMTSCVWSPDGAVFAISAYHFLVIYRLKHSKGGVELVQEHELVPPRITPWGLHTKPCFSHDSHHLLWTHSASGPQARDTESISCIWDVRSGTLETQLISWEMFVEMSLFSPVASGLVAAGARYGKIQLWDVKTSTILRTLERRAPSDLDFREQLSFSPDGTKILSWSPDSTIIEIWDVSSGNLVLTLEPHDREIHYALFSPDGQYVASASNDETVRLCRAQDGVPVAVFSEHASPVTRLAFSSNGLVLCSGGLDGTVIIHRLSEIFSH